MGNVARKIAELKEKTAKIREMGGAKAVGKMHEQGKLTARERLEHFFDPGSFRELDMFVTHRGTLFGLDKLEIPADGVITGYGLVRGRQVFAFSQDFTARILSSVALKILQTCSFHPWQPFRQPCGSLKIRQDHLNARPQMQCEPILRKLRKGPGDWSVWTCIRNNRKA